jgi:hypothetical protein
MAFCQLLAGAADKFFKNFPFGKGAGDVAGSAAT